MCDMVINEGIAEKTNVHTISTAGLHIYSSAEVTSVTCIMPVVAKYINTDRQEMHGSAGSFYMQTFKSYAIFSIQGKWK